MVIGKRLTGIILLSFSALNLLFMHYYVFLNHYNEDVLLAYQHGFNLFGVIIDISILLLLFLLFTWGKLKLSLLLSFITTWLWSFVNVFYVRFFGQYLSLSVMSQASNLTDQAVMNSMMSGFQWTDLWYPIILLAFIAVYRKATIPQLSRKMLWELLLIPFCCLGLTYLTYITYHYAKSDTRNNTILLKGRLRGIMSNGSRNSFPNNERFCAGSLRILAWEVYDLFHTIELSPEQRAAIASEASDTSERVTPEFQANEEIKNVVFVVLESFLSAPIGLEVDGKEITPFMNSLMRDSTVYYNSHVIPNITIGESGDGQFIFMTGLLPLRDKLTVGEAKTQTLPAFPKLLAQKKETQYTEIVIPSPPQVWEQTYMNKVYGIDNMFCNWDVLGKVVDYLNDEQLFTLAMNSQKHLNQPFFSIILSYSTHQPYRTPVDNSMTLSDPSLTNSYKNYLIACHYSDSWLERFVEDLKRKGVYDNCLLIITADHSAHLDAFGMGDKLTKELPLFIIHGNINTEQVWHGPMNQLDIYTTLLDLLKIDSNWHGLGHSILKSDYRNSVTEKTWLLSELIIKGNYFGTKEKQE